MEMRGEEIRLIPIEPFPRGKIKLHEEILKIAKEWKVDVLKPLQAISVSKQERIFDDYIEPYRDQIEAWTSTHVEDIFYHAGEIDLKGFILLEAKDTMIYSSPHLWYLEPFNPTALKPFLERAGVEVVAKAAKIVIKKRRNIANFFKEVLKYLKIIKPSLILTSHGTLIQQRLTDVEKIALENFAKNDKIVFITGWDYKDKGKELINDLLRPEGLIMEGGAVLYPRKNRWHAVELFNQDELNLVKKAWYSLLECASKYLKESVFMSQADKYSICVYINPPNNVRERIPPHREEISSGKKFANELKKRYRTNQSSRR